MNADLEVKSLALAIKRLKPFMGRGRGIPMLEGKMLLSVDRSTQRITLSATNMNTAATADVRGSVAGDGQAILPYRNFLDRAPLFGSTLHLETDEAKERRLKASAGWYALELDTPPADRWPKVPGYGAATGALTAECVYRIQGWVVPFAAKEYDRPALVHVNLTPFEGGLEAAAADGFRLAVLRWVAEGNTLPGPLLLDASALASLPVMDYRVHTDATASVGFEGEGFWATLVKGSGTFPRYQALIPSPSSYWGACAVAAKDLLYAVRLLPAEAGAAGGMRITFRDAQTMLVGLRSQFLDVGENVAGLVTVPLAKKLALHSSDHMDVKVCLDRRYLLSVLSPAAKIDADLTIGLMSPTSPTAFRLDAQGWTAVVMPLFVAW